MDIFKLFFNHDLRLDQLAEADSGGKEGTLEDFMTPTLTFSRFYLTGTQLEDQRFGLSTLHEYKSVLTQLEKAFSAYELHSPHKQEDELSAIIPELPFGQTLLAHLEASKKPPLSTEKLNEVDQRNLTSVKDEIRNTLKENFIILYTVKAQHGYDIQILSMENIYPKLFHAFKEMLSEQFRFFSINSKRIKTEKQFYFETRSLDRPPHGAEEVRPQTTI